MRPARFASSCARAAAERVLGRRRAAGYTRPQSLRRLGRGARAEGKGTPDDREITAADCGDWRSAARRSHWPAGRRTPRRRKPRRRSPNSPAARRPRPGKIAIDLPEIAENGNTVPLTIALDSPMTAEDHVSDILVVAEANPRPDRRHVPPDADVRPRRGRDAHPAGRDRERHRGGAHQQGAVHHGAEAGQGDRRRLRRLKEELGGGTPWPTKVRIKLPSAGEEGRGDRDQDAHLARHGDGLPQGCGRQVPAFRARSSTSSPARSTARPVFSVDLEPATRPNPYLKFFARVEESGYLPLHLGRRRLGRSRPPTRRSR